MKSVETVLLENIDKPDSLFVFPTDISASRWADHILRRKGGTIAMNMFTAWDKFKQNSIKSKVQNKKSIPSALRKIFMDNLIKENAEAAAKGSRTIFTSLIRAEWAQQASRFSPWLTRLLPQLGIWHKIITGVSIDNILDISNKKFYVNLENEEKDMYNMAACYAQFLEKHSFFEPSWETPPFNNDGKNVFLFFPESLSDYAEYSGLLCASSHVRIISAAEDENPPCDAFFYTNSRNEITEAALYIRALNENKNISWNSIAVCIPDSENYEPYLLREFTNRNIPYVKRISKPLSEYPSGGFFRSIADCSINNFSFSSVVSLIGNRNLPWKENELIGMLIQFGIDNNCLYSWIEENNEKKELINVWEDAFEKPFGSIKTQNNTVKTSDAAKTNNIENSGNSERSNLYNVRNFFNNLKKHVSNFRYAKSFSELIKQYFIFRSHFFDMDNCSEETDLVLSRCITELMSLADLEKSYPDIPAPDPFLFFTEHLTGEYYLPQSKSTGVAILPYKTAAAAPYDCHVILGSGQENLSVINKRLDFLPKKRRAELGITDDDASNSFINMHKYNSVKISAFFCCEKTFSHFSTPHSKIKFQEKSKDRYSSDIEHKGKFCGDYYKTENSLLSSYEEKDIENNIKLYENQEKGFNNWSGRRLTSKDNCKNIIFNNEKIIKIINDCFADKAQSGELLSAKTGKYSVSATSLLKYFQCSLKWLFDRVYKIDNLQIETGLMPENISGLIYHEILKEFLIRIKKSGKPLAEPVYENGGPVLPEKYKKLLDECVNDVFNGFPSLRQGGRQQMSALTARMISAGKKDYHTNLKNFLTHFLSFFSGCSVTECEYYLESEKDTYIIRGGIDCILKEPCESKNENSSNNEKYIIVDFKLKNTPSRIDCTAEDGSPLADYQLPMYITLAEANENYKIYTALFYSILNRECEVIFGSIYNEYEEIEIPKNADNRIIKNSEQYNLIFNEFNGKIKQFAEEISSGKFSVYPQKSSSCFNCDYQRICRTVYIIGRENNLLEKK